MRKIIIFFCCCAFFACKQDTGTSSELTDINIRLAKDPVQVNPYFSPTSAGREIFQYIFLQVADIHPETLELCPVLLTQIPKGYETEYKGEEVIAYDLNFRKEATWSDGQPITAQDYLLALNMVIHPESKALAWKPYFNFIKGAKEYGDNEKMLTVYYDKDYMLSLESCLNIIPLPAHIYDPNRVIAKLDLSQLKEASYKSDSLHSKIINTLNQTDKEKTGVVQSGPYKLKSYQDDQYYILEKVDNYWGSQLTDIPMLETRINTITFKVVPDEVSALTMAKDGQLDVMNLSDGKSFLELRDDPDLSQKWAFHTPQLMRYYYVAMNNKHVLLKDPKIRNALSRLVDIDDMIESLEGGLGKRLIGPFHPSKTYYNDNLKPIGFNVDAANSILDKAGWTSRNEEGIRQKNMDGEVQPLSLDLIQTGSSLGKNVSLLIQESFAKAGIKINIVTKKSALMRKENLSNFNYDLILLVAGLDTAADDPYRRWHSDNTLDNKGNYIGYSSATVDKEIESLRLQKSAAAREPYYLKIQEEIYKDQPIIFLYSPLNKIIINKKFKAVTTSKRPGYLANTMSS